MKVKRPEFLSKFIHLIHFLYLKAYSWPTSNVVQTVWIQVNVDSFFINTVQSFKCIFSYGFLNTFFSLAYLIVKNRAL